MRTWAVGIVILAVSTAAWGVMDDTELLNDAWNKAFDQAAASIEATGIQQEKRIGVGNYKDVSDFVNDLLQSRLTKTPFKVQLRTEKEMTELLDEYVRQIEQGDIMKMTSEANKLFTQDVHAVVWISSVGTASVRPIIPFVPFFKSARVEAVLKMASCLAERPGELIWSDRCVATVYPANLKASIAALVVCGVVLLLLFVWFVRRMSRPR